jgi:hypothetical protein
MPRLPKAALTLFAGALLAACAASETSLVDKGLKPLSEADLKALYSRPRTVSWTNVQGNAGTAEYSTDGAVKVAWSTGGVTGTFRIAGNTFCPTLPGVRGGAEYCQRVYKTGDNRYATFLVNGEPNSTFSFTN